MSSSNNSNASLATTLSPSPVAAAFASIRWEDDTDNFDHKLKLTLAQRRLISRAEDNVLGYTLAVSEDAIVYSRLLLHMLDQLVGPRGPSPFVSKLPLQQTTTLSEEQAKQLLQRDVLGVLIHYAISKLYEVVIFLKSNESTSTTTTTSNGNSNSKHSVPITMLKTFYKRDDANELTLDSDWRPLLRLLHLGGKGDAFAQRGAALCLAYILLAANGVGKQEIVQEPLQALISWIASQLQSSSAVLGLVTPALLLLLTESVDARHIFISAGGIGYLTKHLRRASAATTSYVAAVPQSPRSPTPLKKTEATVQQRYELCFCLWTLTYQCHSFDLARSHFSHGAVSALVESVAAAQREKVVRVSVSALRNLATVPDGNAASFLNEMIACGLIKSIDIMKQRQWTDPDILEDLDVLHRLLHENFKEMSNWDVYFAEVESGRLEWSAVHTEKFFQQNAKRMEGNNSDFGIVKRLVQLIQGDDEDVASIACFDLGEFAKEYPNGRAILKRLGVQQILFGLIEHNHVDLQRHALQAASKILIQNWQGVGK